MITVSPFEKGSLSGRLESCLDLSIGDEGTVEKDFFSPDEGFDGALEVACEVIEDFLSAEDV